MTKKARTIDKVSMAILLLAPILSIYGNPGGWNYETICVLPLSFFYFLYYFFSEGNISGQKDPLPKGFIWYFMYWAMLFVITAFQLPLAMIQSYLAFFLFFSTFRREYFIKMYRAFAIICIVFFFMQEASFQLTGIRISGAISFLPKFGAKSMDEYMMLQAEAQRSSSFFSEPAHFAQFLVPLFAIEIFYNQNKHRILLALAIAATLLLLRSGNSLLGLITVLAFLLPYYLGKGSRHRGLTFFLVSVFILAVGYYYFNSEMGASLLERQGEMSMEYEGGSRSGFLRIWRGLFVYEDYSLMEKIIGCPNEAVQLGHVYASGMQMVENAELYFNAFWKILLNTGIIGMGIFIYVIIHIWRGNTVCGKAIIASLVTLSLIAGIYMSHTMIMFMVLAESMKTAPVGAFNGFKSSKVLRPTV